MIAGQIKAGCRAALPAFAAAIALARLAAAQTPGAAAPVQFNRDVRPILAEHCWKCHGVDARARRAGLRLDVREEAVKPADSGVAAIIPGDPGASELLRRVTAADGSERMPPEGSARGLDAAEIDVLKRWIASGAAFERHWAFEPIGAPAMPRSPEARNPIDAFVGAQLAQRRLSFAPEADRATLLRRVSFDLTGLPPTLDDLDRMSTETYEQAVDRLLASPHFGERMAVDWLDAARYADTDGYFGDKPRQMWLWRDWVIDAFNANMPFDQFTIEQLAGDLLPEASLRQKIATGFNRNHMSNDETGIIDEEYRVEYVVDRVDTTMSTWLGLTVGCAQCHDHKYDPITQREYYRLFAFFNNVPESGLLVGHDAPPRVAAPTADQERQLAELAAASDEAFRAFEPLRQAAAAELADQEVQVASRLPEPPGEGVALHVAFDAEPVPPARTAGTSLASAPGIRGQSARFDATQHVEVDLDSFDEDLGWTIGAWILPDGSLSCPISKIDPAGDRRGVEVLWQKGRIYVNLVHRWGADAVEVRTSEPLAAKQWRHVAVRYDASRAAKGLALFIDGQPAALEVLRDTLTGTLANDQPLRIGRRDDGLGYYGQIDEVRLVARPLSADQIAGWARGERLRGILELPADKRSAADVERLLDDFIDRSSSHETRAARDAVRRARQAHQELQQAIPLALVMEEQAAPRVTRILERGQYDRPGEEVLPGVPQALAPWPEGEPTNRLGFARWLFAPNNPLTARVAANRLWRQCFGEGLVRTLNDFGTQGEPPSHPELLDYLAAELRASGWNVKRLLRLMVTSRTYRQDSRFVRRDGEVLDPENRWLSRGPRFRLPMEMIRDQALAASGLLVPRLGGPSVKPYQPPGLWEEVSYNAEQSYEPDRGAGLWRRSLYTYLKRQAPPPALLLLDGPTREKCVLKRPRTNTPQQALLLLNDPSFLEAARSLAAGALAALAASAARLRHLFLRLLSRPPREDEERAILEWLARQQARLAGGHARDLLEMGASPVEERYPPGELAAWTLVAHTLLNLDEAVTRR
jgi:hypothetical protein